MCLVIFFLHRLFVFSTMYNICFYIFLQYSQTEQMGGVYSAQGNGGFLCCFFFFKKGFVQILVIL